MYCNHCGFNLPDGSAFCSKCGNQLGDSSVPPTVTAFTPQNFEIPEVLMPNITFMPNDSNIPPDTLVDVMLLDYGNKLQEISDYLSAQPSLSRFSDIPRLVRSCPSYLWQRIKMSDVHNFLSDLTTLGAKVEIFKSGTGKILTQNFQALSNEQGGSHGMYANGNESSGFNSFLEFIKMVGAVLLGLILFSGLENLFL